MAGTTYIDCLLSFGVQTYDEPEGENHDPGDLSIEGDTGVSQYAFDNYVFTEPNDLVSAVRAAARECPASAPLTPQPIPPGTVAAGNSEVYMKAGLIAIILAISVQSTSALARSTTVVDPAASIQRPFGLGGHSCKQYDDTGRLYIYSEGSPDLNIISWMQRSDNGTKANVPMPEELVQALPSIPDCLPGKHHAASPNR